MKLKNEEQILNMGMRAKIIDEIMNGPENLQRRLSELRKHEIYRDKNRKWVMNALMREGFKDSTLYQMQNRASNISICRKIVNKLANTYLGGVTRTVEDANSQESIDAYTDEIDVDTFLKKADRYLQLFRNSLVQVVPVLDTREQKYALQLRVLAPWQYDVVEDFFDQTKPKVVILSDFVEQHQYTSDFFYDHIGGAQGRRSSGGYSNTQGDMVNQTIADDPADAGTQGDKRTFIWWTDNYHFTTDEKGIIIDAPDNNANPIGLLPFVNVTGDTDGAYWAKGGEDVTEGSILINKMLTDINFITFTQGWGQLVVSARDVPKKLEGGPDNALIFDLKPDDPQPNVFFATSNPPIESWLNTVKTSLAMLLSTNDLSPRNISASLNVTNVASGVALLIEQSESVSDTQEKQKLFQDKEPMVWEVLRRWHDLYHAKKALVENQQAINPFTDSNVNVKFHSLKTVVSEKEQLENIQKRKDLGLNTMAELLRIDNPDLSEQESLERAEEIMNEKKDRQQSMMGNVMNGIKSNLKPEENKDAETEKGSESVREEDKKEQGRQKGSKEEAPRVS